MFPVYSSIKEHDIWTFPYSGSLIGKEVLWVKFNQLKRANLQAYLNI